MTREKEKINKIDELTVRVDKIRSSSNGISDIKQLSAHATSNGSATSNLAFITPHSSSSEGLCPRHDLDLL